MTQPLQLDGSPGDASPCAPGVPFHRRTHVTRDALRELEDTVRLLEQIDDVLGPLGITDQFRLRIRERIGAIRITLRREWNTRKGGKQGDES